MHKFMILAAGASALLVALGVGVWTGAVYHDRLALALAPNAPTGTATSADQPAQIKAATDQPASPGKTLYHCGMHPWIIQDHPGNCPICKMELTPIQNNATAQTASSEKKILYYWDPMVGSSSVSQKPGKSAMGMDLIPVYADQFSGGPAVTIDPAVVQNMGVQTAAATRGSLTKTLRTVGYLEVPETGLYDMTLKVNGYIDKLYANETGMHIHKGEPLFDLYSPELVVAEEELIAARKSVEAMSGASEEIRKQADNLLDSARQKLQLLDVPDTFIDTVAKQDHAAREITILSPAEGHLEDKMIVQGSSVQSGMKLLRIEDHRSLWLEAQVYEDQISLIKPGEIADAELDGIPGKTFSGKIMFIAPHLNHMTRTITVRVALENPDFTLKPGMYATVHIHTEPLTDVLMVPREAVIDTGTRKITFVQEAQGHFSPRLVTTGISGDNDQMQILSGIAPGERVVTSGQFLMDVESRTQEAIQKLQTPEPSTTQPARAATEGPGTSPTTTPAAAPASMPAMVSGRTDGVAKAYLRVAAYLQTEGAESHPVDVTELLTASDKLLQIAPLDEQALAAAVHNSVTAMKGASLEQQRKGFEKVGAAMVSLFERDPPSTAIAGKLYVVSCPMENADWLQTEENVLNPFLPSMRMCGSVTRTILLMPAR